MTIYTPFVPERDEWWNTEYPIYGNKLIQRKRGKMKDFLKYLNSLWGLVSLSTLLFPQSIKLFELIKPPQSWKVNEDLVLNLSTIICVFLLLVLYTRRREHYYVIGEAVFLFVGSIVCIWVYLDPLHGGLFGNLIDFIIYFGIFACLTGSFTILAIMDRFQ